MGTFSPFPISLVLGLGNPGVRYSRTRHNVGFRIVDSLFDRLGRGGCAWNESHGGLAAEIRLEGEKVKLFKPLQYMNRSGECAAVFMRFFKVPVEEVLVVHDEVDLPFGTIRLKQGGGEAGHNGLRSLTSHLGGNQYARLRFGVGKGPYETADWVLEKFSPDEEKSIGPLLDDACEAAIECIKHGIASAQNKFHRDTAKEND